MHSPAWLIAAFVALMVPVAADAQQNPTAPPGKWTELGGGIAGSYVSDMVVLGAELIAAGDFTAAGGQPAARIAAWDGQSWSALGPGFPGRVTAMTVHDGQLVVGYRSTVYEDEKIKVWDGTAWSDIAWGHRTPTAMASYGGRLYVATQDYVSPTSAVLVAHLSWLEAGTWVYDQQTFAPGPDMYDQARIDALDVVDGSLFIGGLLADRGTFRIDPRPGGSIWVPARTRCTTSRRITAASSPWATIRPS